MGPKPPQRSRSRGMVRPPLTISVTTLLEPLSAVRLPTERAGLWAEVEAWAPGGRWTPAVPWVKAGPWAKPEPWGRMLAILQPVVIRGTVRVVKPPKIVAVIFAAYRPMACFCAVPPRAMMAAHHRPPRMKGVAVMPATAALSTRSGSVLSCSWPWPDAGGLKGDDGRP